MKDIDAPDSEVVFGHRACQTSNAKWLCVDNIYQKLHRPNLHDIGGTYTEDIADYWFLCQVEIIADLHLLHLYVHNRPGGSFDISVSISSEMTTNKKFKQAFLSSTLETYKFRNQCEQSHNYITTYSFSTLDLEVLKDMKLYIPILFGNSTNNEVVDEVTTDYDFKSLLSDPVWSDFVIESADGCKFNVHRMLLSSSSEVFKAMLKENTAESQNSYLKIIDVSKEDLQLILEFIYTGTIEDIENANFINLLTLSDRYNLTGLKELSEHVLFGRLSENNCIETLVIADLLNCEELKLKVLKFIKSNKTALYNDMFNELNNVELLRELCQFLVPST